MPELNHFLFQCGVFIVVYACLTHFVFKPALRVLKERERRIVGDKQEAKRLVEMAEERIKSYEDKIYHAKTDAKEAKSQMLQEATQEERSILASAREESSRIISNTQDRIAKEGKEMIPQIKKEAEGLASDMASAVLGRRV